MPTLTFPNMSAGFWHKPQDFVDRFHRIGEDAFADKIRCLPLKHKNSKSNVGRQEAFRKLAHDVELLSEQMEGNPECAEHGAERENLMSISQDVQTQVQKIFTVIKDLAGQLPCPRHTTNSLEKESEAELLENMLAADIPVQLLAELPLLEFEARKDVMNMCCALLWAEMPEHIESQVLEYLIHHPRLFAILVDGYGKEETALHYGVVLRSCSRHAGLVEAFLASGKMFDLIQYAQHPSIDIASDAFYTLKEFLLEHKEVSAPWLDDHASEFFLCYNHLLESGGYLVERQALTLLGGMLLDRQFKKVALAYVSNDKNLRVHMNLLRDKSMAIQVEAFHVFKVFVANPKKTARVQHILCKNKDRLVALLETLHAKPEDQKFSDEQRSTIEKLRPLVPKPASPKTDDDSPKERTQSGHTLTAL